MADYPNSVYSPRTKANKAGVAYDAAKTTIGYAEDVTKLDDEVVAIETELGANPKGVYASVAAFLSDLLTKVGLKQTLYDAVVATSGGDYTLPSAAFADGKAKVFIRSGTYTETGNITIPASGALVGESLTGVVIDFNDATTLKIELGSGSVMEKLTIKGNNRTTGAVVGAAASDNIRVQNVKFFECVKCLVTVGSDFITSKCDFEDFTVTGLEMSGTRGKTINNYFDGAANAAVCISAITSNYQTINGNSMYGQFDTGIYVNGPDYVLISNNHIEASSGNRNYGIRVANCSRFSMTGNYIKGFTGTPGEGVKIESTSGQFTFQGNIVTGCDTGIDFSYVSDGTIVSNIMSGNTSWADSTGASNIQEGYQVT